ncbi:MAG TPA: hypothetical protein DCY42_07185 [Chloroflexi bacterium]|nr:hypothetical protein [Chloroflexota bacterium]
MSTKIELFDQERSANRLGFLVGSSLFFVAWFIRAALKLLEVHFDAIYSILMVLLLISIGVQVVFALKDHRLNARMKSNPLLKEAMNDELIQLNELKAWKTAFFALIGFILFAAILSMAMVIKDPMLIYLTALLVGFGTRNMAVYILNR